MDDKTKLTLEKFNNRADRLIDVLAYENSKDMEDLVVLIFDTIKEVKKGLERVLSANTDDSNKRLLDFNKELTTLGKEAKRLLADAEDVISKTEILRSEVSEKLPVIDTLTTRHNEMELELAEIHSKLDEGEIRLGDDIRGVRDELKSMTTKLEESIIDARKEAASRSSGGVRRVFQPYVERFTSQTDGATKTFYLSREPLRTDTIEVSGTDFPIILDPTVDFTVAGKAVTLAAGVPAPSQGATLIIKFYA